ncbi:MAG: cyclic nucleotide-binding domain-containing protein [Pseudomonadota bacterium]
MVNLTDLKRINLLKTIPDHLLEIIAKEAQLSIFGTGTQLIVDQEKSETFYMLVMGQVAVKQQLTPDIDIIFAYIQSGASFGIPALLRNQKASYTAVCQEPCEVITLSGERMLELFDQNHELAYYMLKGAANQYKQNMDQSAQMVVKVLDENPALLESIDEIETPTLVI